MSEATASAAQGADSKHHSFPEFANLFTIRYTVFVFMEAAFTALAWYCYSHPRRLPGYAFFDYFNNGTIKSGFIVLFNLWHNIAIACAIVTCADSFSREWAARDKRTDEVSTVTSGIIDRIFYSFRPRATKTFRTAFLVFLGLVVMRMIGSSIVTVTDGVPSEHSLRISIFTPNLTTDATDANNPTFTIRLLQANMILRLEQLLGAPWGYVPQHNWLIPLPTESLSMTSQVDYESDLIRFEHICQWRAPDSYSDDTVTVGNVIWRGRFFSNATEFIQRGNYSVRNGSSIMQLGPINGSASGISVYLFLGGNSSLPVNTTGSNEGWLDLGSLPTVLNPDGFVTQRNPTLQVVRSSFATLLVCDPQLDFTCGDVHFSPTPNRTEPDITIPEDKLRPNKHVGNIDRSAARVLFTSILSSALSQKDPQLPAGFPALRSMPFLNFNTVAAQMFLQLPPYQDRNWTTIGSVRPLDLSTINHYIDNYTLSALKAFTSGYKGDANIRQVANVAAAEVRARYITTRLALATSIQFAILHTVLFFAMTLGLAGLAYLNRTQGREPFNLVSLGKGERSKNDQEVFEAQDML